MYRQSMNALIAFVFLALAACTSTQNLSKQVQFTPPPGPFKVAIMKPDVQVSTLTAGGLEEPNADWTRQAQENLLRSLNTQLASKSGTVIPAEALSTLDTKQVADFERLHRVVGYTIMSHRFFGLADLPTKKDVFDWTLGSQANEIRAATNADYALFLYARDSFSSGGRVAATIFMAALGVGLPGGQQVGFVSLVDLKTGNVVWFNVLAKGTGDLRDPQGADNSVRSLIKDMPVTPVAAVKK
jgi:hypothetical protein